MINKLKTEYELTMKEQFLNHFMNMLSKDYNEVCDKETLLTCFIEFALLFELIDEAQEKALLDVVYQE